MFNLTDAYKDITLDFIFSKVSEYELWKYYCTNFEKFDQSFRSDLYNDRNPSCRILKTKFGSYYYKDYGENHYFASIIEYIKYKYNCTYNEGLNIIANDFNLYKSNISINRIIPLNNVEKRLIIKPKTIIEPSKQSFNLTDYKYWNQYKISLDSLEIEEIYSCKSIYLKSPKGEFIYNSSRSYPIYAFKEYDVDLNFIGWKIYQPFGNKYTKWINNSSYKSVQGIKTLLNNKDLLIIGKARKDGLVYKLLGIDCVSPQNETSDLDSNGIFEFSKSYNKVLVNFDPDEQGLRESFKIKEKYNYDRFFINKTKDISDYIVDNTLLKAKRMINKKIKELDD